jgi:hypothetical protein
VIRPLVAFLLFATLPPARAAGEDFAISIVGSSQSEQLPDKLEKGIPIIFLPADLARKPIDQAFYVVVRNSRESASTITMLTSSWYNSLEFSITDSSGKTHSVKRGLQNWFANAQEPWVFAAGGVRIFPINFTDGKWSGLPPAPSRPQAAKMTATFTYDAKSERRTVSSPQTNVVLDAR